MRCPTWGRKPLKTYKTYLDCAKCGVFILMKGSNQPIFDIRPEDLNLQFQQDLSINYYICDTGITVEWLVGLWKMIVLICDKSNYRKQFLLFCTWTRNLNSYIKYGYHYAAEGTELTLLAKKGTCSSNIYDKKLIRLLIEALKKITNELNLIIKNKGD